MDGTFSDGQVLCLALNNEVLSHPAFQGYGLRLHCYTSFRNSLRSPFQSGVGSPSLLACSCTSVKSKGSKKIIELEGNPTTGYTWVYTVEDEALISIKESEKYLGKNGMVGAPSLFTYKITALKRGATKILFEYKRPWEENPPLETKVYGITIEQNGKLLNLQINQQ